MGSHIAASPGRVTIDVLSTITSSGLVSLHNHSIACADIHFLAFNAPTVTAPGARKFPISASIISVIRLVLHLPFLLIFVDVVKTGSIDLFAALQ